MTNEEKVQYWINLSDGDLEVAKTMLNAKHHLYVAFMCHQVIEKIFKGYYTKLAEDTPPFTHSLADLSEKGGFADLLTEEQKAFVDRLDPLNIRARYPDYKNKLANMLTHKVCVEIFEQTKILQQWIKEKLL
jgi:HEPN domain-containing protein